MTTLITAERARELRDGVERARAVPCGAPCAGWCRACQARLVASNVASAAAPDLADTVIALSEQLARVTEERDAIREDLAATQHALDCEREDAAELRAIIEGRTTPPTDEEIDAHHEARGEWLLHVADCGAIAIDEPSTLRSFLRMDPWRRMWALDADSRPCAWPVVTTEAPDVR